MAIKLNSDEQKQAISTVININGEINDTLVAMAKGMSELNYQGAAADALQDNCVAFEKAINGNVDQFAEIIEVCKKNIEITEDMEKAAHLKDRVSEKSASVTITQKKNVSIGGLA